MRGSSGRQQIWAMMVVKTNCKQHSEGPDVDWLEEVEEEDGA